MRKGYAQLIGALLMILNLGSQSAIAQNQGDLIKRVVDGEHKIKSVRDYSMQKIDGVPQDVLTFSCVFGEEEQILTLPVSCIAIVPDDSRTIGESVVVFELGDDIKPNSFTYLPNKPALFLIKNWRTLKARIFVHPEEAYQYRP